MNKVSVVLFTFTGTGTIRRCLESILKQKTSAARIETVVVIDGPSQIMYDTINSFKKRFANKGIGFKIHQFDRNRGRYTALTKGVELASGRWLLIMGDKILLPSGYIDKALKLNENVIIPHTIEEGWEKSSLNRTLHLIRDRIYSRKGLRSFDHHLDNESFEKSAKGTGGVLIKKEIFLRASRNMTNIGAEKHVSDDIRLLREVVNLREKPLLTDKIHIIYVPRKGFLNQLDHIYRRGPLFVNYYIRNGTRFHPHLLGLFAFSLVALVVLFLYPSLAIWFGGLVLGAILSVALYFAQSLSDFLLLLWTVPLIGLFFFLGLLKGLIIHLAYGKD